MALCVAMVAFEHVPTCSGLLGRAAPFCEAVMQWYDTNLSYVSIITANWHLTPTAATMEQTDTCA